MSDRSSQSGKFSSGAQVLQALFENGKSPLSDQFLRWKIWRRWADLVGKSIAEVSEPVGLRRGTLYVWVKNSTWMQQLVFMNDPIRDALNKKLGEKVVQQIRWTLDRGALPDSPQESEQLKKSIENLTVEED